MNGGWLFHCQGRDRPLHEAGCGTHFHHIVWADDQVFLATSAAPALMIEELILAIAAARARVEAVCVRALSGGSDADLQAAG